jgi:benzoyl-CoA reductase subunit C
VENLFKAFAQVAAEPLEYAKGWKDTHRKRVIGSFPMHFPGELAHAADALPIILQQSTEPITIGHGSIFPFYCGYTRSVVDQALHGRFGFLDAIMFGDHCVQLLGAADAIRCELPETKILFNQLISSMSVPWAFEEARTAFHNVKLDLEELIGHELSDDSIRASIRIYNKNRTLIRRLFDLRRAGTIAITARQLQHVVKSSMVMDKQDHSQLLEQLIGELEKQSAPRREGVRLFLSGHLCHPPKPEILDLIEECGGTVVDDDLYHGYRYVATDMDETGDPLDALANWYLTRNKRVPCPTRVDNHADWDAYLVGAVGRAKAEGVIVLMAKFCEPHMYWYPEIKEAFERHGIPHLLVETEHESMPLEALKTRVETFLEIVKRRAAAEVV